MTVTPVDVARAAEVVPQIAVPTRLERSARLSARYAADVLLEREDQQVGRSYKVRGAYTVMPRSTPASSPSGSWVPAPATTARGWR